MNLTPYAVALILVWGSVVLFSASIRTFIITSAISSAILAFGPVLVRYVETGDASLGWEAGFRLILLLIAVWAATQFTKLLDGAK